MARSGRSPSADGDGWELEGHGVGCVPVRRTSLRRRSRCGPAALAGRRPSGQARGICRRWFGFLALEVARPETPAVLGLLSGQDDINAGYVAVRALAVVPRRCRSRIGYDQSVAAQLVDIRILQSQYRRM